MTKTMATLSPVGRSLFSRADKITATVKTEMSNTNTKTVLHLSLSLITSLTAMDTTNKHRLIEPEHLRSHVYERTHLN